MVFIFSSWVNAREWSLYSNCTRLEYAMYVLNGKICNLHALSQFSLHIFWLSRAELASSHVIK
jgi:hypothetical protein